jgi:hypothetical protein
MRHQPPHLTSPRVMLQSMGSPIAGRGTEKDSGFDARASPTALPSWSPLSVHSPRAPPALGLFCLCGERLGEGNCHHLMHRERTHFLDELKEGMQREDLKSLPSFTPNLLPTIRPQKASHYRPKIPVNFFCPACRMRHPPPSPNLSPRACCRAWDHPSRGEGLKKTAVSMQERPDSAA